MKRKVTADANAKIPGSSGKKSALDKFSSKVARLARSAFNKSERPDSDTEASPRASKPIKNPRPKLAKDRFAGVEAPSSRNEILTDPAQRSKENQKPIIGALPDLPRARFPGGLPTRSSTFRIQPPPSDCNCDVDSGQTGRLLQMAEFHQAGCSSRPFCVHGTAVCSSSSTGLGGKEYVTERRKSEDGSEDTYGHRRSHVDSRRTTRSMTARKRALPTLPSDIPATQREDLPGRRFLFNMRRTRENKNPGPSVGSSPPGGQGLQGPLPRECCISLGWCRRGFPRRSGPRGCAWSPRSLVGL